jgi:DNA-binding GntR family transcriptional regulator
MDPELYTAPDPGLDPIAEAARGFAAKDGRAGRGSSSDALLRRESAYNQLRKLVLLGTFPFGQRLAEEKVADLLSVSRTPVREAFVRLQADRLLHRYADGGYYVAEPDLLDLRDLYELRVTLELRGLHRAMEQDYKHDLAVVEPLRDQWRAIGDDAPEPDPSFVELDESFHVTLSRSAGNIAIAETLETVNARIRPVRMYDFLTSDRITLTISEHLGILEAVLVNDLPLAESRMREHIGASMEVVEKRAAQAITQMIINRRTRR